MNTADITSWIVATKDLGSVEQTWTRHQHWEVAARLILLEDPEIYFYIRQWGRGKKIEITLQGDNTVAVFSSKSSKEPLAKLFAYDTRALNANRGQWNLKAEKKNHLAEKIQKKEPLWCRIFYEDPLHTPLKEQVEWVKIKYPGNIEN